MHGMILTLSIVTRWSRGENSSLSFDWEWPFDGTAGNTSTKAPSREANLKIPPNASAEERNKVVNLGALRSANIYQLPGNFTSIGLSEGQKI